MRLISHYPIAPTPAPRQVRSDAWKPSPRVLRYRAFQDEVKLRRVQLPPGAHVVFLLPMPKSWSKPRRDLARLEPHRQKPDLDNLLKALLDAIYRGQDDAAVASLTMAKRWYWRPAILIANFPMELGELREALWQFDQQTVVSGPAVLMASVRDYGVSLRPWSARDAAAGLDV